MVTIVLPEPESIDVPMVPEVVLGGPPSFESEADAHRASVGVPVVMPVTDAELSEDPHLASYVQDSGFQFYLVLLTCSLGAAREETIDSAVVAIDLAASKESGDDDPIAWSLAPLRLIEKVPRPKLTAGLEISLGPFLKIKGDWAPSEQGGSCYVHALGENESDPEWRYRATTREQLLGGHDMTMIVRVRPGVKATGTVRISATIGRPGFLRRRILQTPERFREFTLAPATNQGG